MWAGEVYAPKTELDSSILRDPWQEAHAAHLWTPVVYPTGFRVAVPVSDVRRAVSLRHKHMNLGGEYDCMEIQELLEHVVTGFPGDMDCCAPRLGVGGELEWQCVVDPEPMYNQFEVVGAGSGRPFRLETTRTHHSKQATAAVP